MSKRKKTVIHNINSKQVNDAITRRYMINKDKIDAAYDYVSAQGSSPLEAFSAEIKETMLIKKVSVAEATKITFRSEIFTPEGDRIKANLIKKIRSTKNEGEHSAYAKFRAYTRHQKIDLNKLQYKGYDSDGTAIYEYTYSSGKVVQITITHSPSIVDIRKLW